MAVRHTSLDADGKISGKKWGADHLFTRMLFGVKARTLFVKFPDGKAYAGSSGTWVTRSATQTQIAFDYLKPSHIRIMTYQSNDHTGPSPYPGVKLSHAGGDLCETGDISSGTALKVGSWTATSIEEDTLCYLRTKSKTGVTLTLYNVGVEIRYG